MPSRSRALLLTGCGDHTDSGNSTGTGSPSASAPLADKLPADIRKAGVIKVDSDIAYPPVEYLKDGKAVGIDPDIAAALGKQLGVRFDSSGRARPSHGSAHNGCWTAWAWATGPATTRPSCPAVSSSVWRSPGRWRWSPS